MSTGVFSLIVATIVLLTFAVNVGTDTIPAWKFFFAMGLGLWFGFWIGKKD